MLKWMTLGAALFLGAAEARALTVVQCAFGTDVSNWVPRTLVMGYTDGEAKLTVSDTVSQHFINAPVEGRITRARRDTLRVRWVLPQVRDKQGTASTMVYTGVYDKAAGSMDLTASPQGFSEAFRGNGACERIDELTLAEFRARLAAVTPDNRPEDALQTTTATATAPSRLWAPGRNRVFSCVATNASDAPAWALSQLRVKHLLAQRAIGIGGRTAGAGAIDPVGGRVREGDGPVAYTWAMSIADPEGRRGRDPLAAVVAFDLTLDPATGRGTLRADPGATRRRARVHEAQVTCQQR